MKSILPFTEEHEAFRAEYAEFVEKEMVPYYNKWHLEDREVPHELYEKMGKKGWLCMWADKKYGGQEKDFLYSVIQIQEQSRRGLSAVGNWLHSDVVSPYVNTLATQEVKDEVMPQLVSGEKLICICMTEPEHGSDLGAIEATAVKDGDEYVINAHKIYTTNGMISDYAVVAALTSPELGPKGISLFLVDLHAEGVERTKLRKHGFHAQDTAEIFFKNVRVPAKNLLGVENKGYGYLMMNLQHERTVAAQLAQGQAERCVEITAKWCNERKMFGKTLARMQSAQFTMADMAIAVDAGRALVDAVTINVLNETATPKDVSEAKAYCTETAFQVASKGLQLCGGQGFCYEDAEIGRLFDDTRIQCFSAGTTEVMKLLVSRAVLSE